MIVSLTHHPSFWAGPTMTGPNVNFLHMGWTCLLKLTNDDHCHHQFSDSDSDSNLDHGHTISSSLLHANLSNSIFKSYLEFTNQSSPSALNLSKIQSFLTISSSGALSCLKCLERIKPSHLTWSCSSLCFFVFHLACIQNWSHQSSDLSAAHATTCLLISSQHTSEIST